MSDFQQIALVEKSQRETVRVGLNVYQGHRLFDLRIVVPLAAHVPDLVPTGKGVALNIAKLPETIAALQAAQARAVELGWLTEGGDAA